jgi:hypothetical protein
MLTHVGWSACVPSRVEPIDSFVIYVDIKLVRIASATVAYSSTTTGSPMLTALKYHSASAGLRLMQPWLTFS